MGRRGGDFQAIPEGRLVWQFGTLGSLDRRTGFVNFFPALGVRYPEAVDLEGSFLGLSGTAAKQTASTGRALRDMLPPGERGWTRYLLRSEEQADSVASLIFEDFTNYGLSYYEPFDSVASLISYMRESSKASDRKQDVTRKLAIMDALMGDTTEALASLGSFVVEARMQSGSIAEQSWRFVRSFVDYFGIGAEFLG
jgi:hypothetical protein